MTAPDLQVSPAFVFTATERRFSASSGGAGGLYGQQSSAGDAALAAINVHPAAAIGAGNQAPSPWQNYRPLERVTPPPRASGVYVLQGEAFPYFKIGTSHDLKHRAAVLRTSVPGGAILVAWWKAFSARGTEVDLQARLAPWLVNGEWFLATEEATALVVGWRDRGLPKATSMMRRPPFSWPAKRAWLSHFYTARRAGASPERARRIAEEATCVS